MVIKKEQLGRFSNNTTFQKGNLPTLTVILMGLTIVYSLSVRYQREDAETISLDIKLCEI